MVVQLALLQDLAIESDVDHFASLRQLHDQMLRKAFQNRKALEQTDQVIQFPLNLLSGTHTCHFDTLAEKPKQPGPCFGQGPVQIVKFETPTEEDVWSGYVF